jgi:hypothetical protein
MLGSRVSGSKTLLSDMFFTTLSNICNVLTGQEEISRRRLVVQSARLYIKCLLVLFLRAVGDLEATAF